MKVKRLIVVVALGAAFALTPNLLGIHTGSALAASPSIIYNSIPGQTAPASLPGDGPEAHAFNEFGNQIKFAGDDGPQLSSVTVGLDSSAC